MNKELREQFRQAEALRWGKDQKMIDYCCKKADIVYPVRGYLAEIERPSIETSFCYGYGYCGVSTEEDHRDAARMADHARTNEDYFIAENLHGLNGYIEALGDVRVLTPHFCRHTYVSQMQALGVDLATIQSMVGHADLDMTQHYLHVQSPVKQKAVEAFNKAFLGNDPGSSQIPVGA